MAKKEEEEEGKKEYKKQDKTKTGDHRLSDDGKDNCCNDDCHFCYYQ